MITFHFHLQPQYKYELFHIIFTIRKEHTERLLCFRKRIFNILVESLQWKQTGHGFVHSFYYFEEIETLGNCTYISMKLQIWIVRTTIVRNLKFVYELVTPAADTTCKVIKLILQRSMKSPIY